ncbi:MAG TPA: hypothetical protein VFL64_12950 [Rhizobacter sp.]|nr:hypothetical protein [Rhizobacter sp.]
MNDWMSEAERLVRQRAPLLSVEHARDLADDLYRAWPDNTPAEAVAKFFRVMPRDWNAGPPAAANTPAENAPEARSAA